MLEGDGLNGGGLVCERHIGAGIPIADIQRQKRPLPLREMVPTSLEEIIVCYADKFFSKGNGGHERRPEEVVAELARYGPEKVAIFNRWHHRFNRHCHPGAGGDADSPNGKRFQGVIV